MKKIFFALCSCALLFTGCKETDVPLDFNHTASTDSIYLSPVPAAQAHNVLAEEFSGQSCPNCPAGHIDLEALSSANIGRINIIGYYASGSPQEVPPSGNVYDFEDSTATAVLNSIYGGGGFLPGAGIDRTVFGGNLYLGESSWDADVLSLLNVSDSANLNVTSTYETANNITTATITTIVTYTQAVTTPQNLTIAIVEDSMIDRQEDNTAASGYDSAYVFIGVFRSMVTNGFAGDPILADTTKVAGMTERKVYTYILPKRTPAINPAHCRVIAFIGSGVSPYTPVWQSQQCQLGQ